MLDQQEQNCLDMIEKHGCMIMHVMAEGDLPRFSYSVGIGKTHGRPDVVVNGLDQDLSHSIINDYQQRLQEGEVFEAESFHDDFLEGFPVFFLPVDRKHYREHFGWNRWLYKDDDFDMLQIVVPTTSGAWPWDDKAPPAYLQQQPLLGAIPVTD